MSASPTAAGSPRLVFTIGSDQWDGTPAREFALMEVVTEIGSADGATLRLEGIEGQAARIVREDDDEYVLYVLGDVEHGTDGDPHDAPPREVLRHGAKVQVGPWSMFFQRDEAADQTQPENDDAPAGARP